MTVTITLHVSDQLAALIDTARGSSSRPAWVTRLVRQTLTEAPDPATRRAARAPRDCTHPGVGRKQLCRACGKYNV